MADETETPLTPEEEHYRGVTRSLVEPLLGTPEALEFTSSVTRSGVVLTMQVHPDDAGRVIGKGGGTIRAIRSALEFAGESRGHVVTVDLADD